MDTVGNHEPGDSRLAWEADRISEARADIAAGRVVTLEAFTAWVDSLDTDHPLPPPVPLQDLDR